MNATLVKNHLIEFLSADHSLRPDGTQEAADKLKGLIEQSSTLENLLDWLTFEIAMTAMKLSIHNQDKLQPYLNLLGEVLIQVRRPDLFIKA